MRNGLTFYTFLRNLDMSAALREGVPGRSRPRVLGAGIAQVLTGWEGFLHIRFKGLIQRIPPPKPGRWIRPLLFSLKLTLMFSVASGFFVVNCEFFMNR